MRLGRCLRGIWRSRGEEGPMEIGGGEAGAAGGGEAGGVVGGRFDGDGPRGDGRGGAV